MSTSKKGYIEFVNETGYGAIHEPSAPPLGQNFDPPPPPYSDIQQAPHPQIMSTNSQCLPNDYYKLSLIVTIFCCLPLGILGLLKSMEARTQFAAGDTTEAVYSARAAQRYSYMGLWFGIAFFSGAIVISIILIVAV